MKGVHPTYEGVVLSLSFVDQIDVFEVVLHCEFYDDTSTRTMLENWASCDLVMVMESA